MGYSLSLSDDGRVLIAGLPRGNDIYGTGKVNIYSLGDTSKPLTGPSGSTGDSSSSKNIVDGSNEVHTFQSNETVVWTISGGSDAKIFNIDTSSGALTFKSEADYHDPKDSDKNNKYNLSVKATDSTGNTSTQEVNLEVTSKLTSLYNDKKDTGYIYSYTSAEALPVISPLLIELPKMVPFLPSP